MTTRRRLTESEALAISDDESTVWGLAHDSSDRLEIEAAVRLVHQAERLRDESVLRARQRGLPWFAIGAALGMTAEGARKKYGPRT